MGMVSRVNHKELIRRGSDLHEARRYAAALPLFQRALKLSPTCLVAEYNVANTLHMLCRHVEADAILRRLIATKLESLRRRCHAHRARSVQLDSYQLLFWVTLYIRGFCKEAFAFGEAHLRRRSRGLRSVWTARKVRQDLATMRKQWSQPNSK
jgi:tetratricopeptide (TPR) repeat protein